MQCMEEIWKDIYFVDSITGEVFDYRGYYQVSNLGRIKSLDRVVQRNKNGKVFSLTIHGRIMQWKYNQHYWTIGLMKDNKTKFLLVHRIVAHMFVPNTNNLPEVNHIDENTWNPVATNLEWCDRNYNIVYGTVQKRHGHTISKPVLQYSLQGDFIKKWDSYNDAAVELGLNRGSISDCVLKTAHSHGGYMWKGFYGVIEDKIEPYDVHGHRRGPHTEKKIIQCDLSGKELKKWYSLASVCKELGIKQPSLSNCLSGRTKTCGGFKWKKAS